MTKLLKTHGLAKTKIYHIWKGMNDRCENKNNKSYYLYGGKGITVCNEWKNLDTFVKWAYENGYEDKLTIDRIDSSKGYSPDNCRWATRKVQNNNTSRNHLITYNGCTKTMAQWSEDQGISYDALKSRLNKYGWSIKKALETPVK